MTDNSPRKRARGLDRAFDILDHLRAVRRPLKPAEIAQNMGAPKSTIYDLVGTLCDHGMLEPAGSDGEVYLGRRLYFLGLAYMDQFDLTREAGKVLSEITASTNETSQFCMLDGDKYTVALMQEGARAFRISADVGERTAIPWTASGRLLLGHMSDEEIIALIPPGDFILPDGSRMLPEQFIAEIRKAHAAEFFSFDSIADTFTHCFAAPVTDRAGHCVATVCIVAPKADASAHYDHYRETLLTAAQKLSALV